jgi:hypothetical protein
MSETGRTEQDQAAEARLRLIVAMLSLAYSMWMIWLMIPKHQRQLARMRLLATAKTYATKCARRAGAAGMQAELATGAENYVLPYSLSQFGEWLGRAYDKTRDVNP